MQESLIHAHLVCNNLESGGAARATLRLIEVLEQQGGELGLQMTVRVAQGRTRGAKTNATLPQGWPRVRRQVSFRAHRARWAARKVQRGSGLRSAADIWTGIGRETNRLQPDVVNLHWIGSGTLSIEEVAAIRAPKVLTLTDMWYFCGSEHISAESRYEEGYTRASRDALDRGFDIDRWTWRRKAKHWKTPMHIVAKSQWIAECARKSALMAGWPVRVIPNAIDSAVWAPINRKEARDTLGLPRDALVVLFGAVGGLSQPIKGGDLLTEALEVLSASMPPSQFPQGVELVTFGGKRPQVERLGAAAIPVHELGVISEDRLLRAVYSAADVMVVPSRIDTFPNTALEAQACGTPVVAFNVAGLPDIVRDGVTGRLARPFDARELAAGIAWCLDQERAPVLSANARESVQRFNPRLVAASYADVYREAVESRARQSRTANPISGLM